MTHISHNQIASTNGRHQATPVRTGVPFGMWEVSWLPGRELTRDQAISAMILTDFIDHRPLTPQDPRWPYINEWAGDFGLTGPAAVDKIRGESR